MLLPVLQLLLLWWMGCFTECQGDLVDIKLLEPTGGGIAGWFIYEMTPEEPQNKPLRFDALDEAGEVIGRSPRPRGA